MDEGAASNFTSVWNQFDQDIDQILELMAKVVADKKFQAITSITINLTVERFGEEEKKEAKIPYTKQIIEK